MGRIRTEKYLEKSEILKDLSIIESEGKELATILKLRPENRAKEKSC